MDRVEIVVRHWLMRRRAGASRRTVSRLRSAATATAMFTSPAPVTCTPHCHLRRRVEFVNSVDEKESATQSAVPHGQRFGVVDGSVPPAQSGPIGKLHDHDTPLAGGLTLGNLGFATANEITASVPSDGGGG
jgi:hypothetical protein